MCEALGREKGEIPERAAGAVLGRGPWDDLPMLMRKPEADVSGPLGRTGLVHESSCASRRSSPSGAWGDLPFADGREIRGLSYYDPQRLVLAGGPDNLIAKVSSSPINRELVGLTSRPRRSGRPRAILRHHA